MVSFVAGKGNSGQTKSHGRNGDPKFNREKVTTCCINKASFIFLFFGTIFIIIITTQEKEKVQTLMKNTGNALIIDLKNDWSGTLNCFWFCRCLYNCVIL